MCDDRAREERREKALACEGLDDACRRCGRQGLKAIARSMSNRGRPLDRKKGKC